MVPGVPLGSAVVDETDGVAPVLVSTVVLTGAPSGVVVAGVLTSSPVVVGPALPVDVPPPPVVLVRVPPLLPLLVVVAVTPDCVLIGLVVAPLPVVDVTPVPVIVPVPVLLVV